jgi:lysophospholipase L1-like esterase
VTETATFRSFVVRTCMSDRVTTSTSEVIACLGASITEARGSFAWIRELELRPRNRRYRWINLGVGGDLAYSALKRLPDVVACRPDVVIVAVGWNDIVTRVFTNARHFLGAWKRLPNEPTPEWFRQSLREIVHRLKALTSARVALVSLSEMGEAPDSAQPVQRHLNDLFAEYSAIIAAIADEEKVGYIPLYERLHAEIVASPGRAFTAFRFRSFYFDAFRQFVLRRSLDEIAAANGWEFHVDGLHLNTRGGMVLANLVQTYLDGL